MAASKLCRRHGNASGGSLSLPEDIVFELLVRLPAKALCRFRCVCKAWRALISDPAFVASQRSHAGPLIVAAFGSTTTDWQQLRLLDKDGGVLRVFDVSGTALLASTRLGLIFVDRRNLGAMIIDPVSRCVSTVVGTKDPLPPSWERLFTSTKVSDYSSGRATPSGVYKVLRLNRSRCKVVTVMDSGVAETTWRQRPWGPFRLGPIFPSERKATVNGVLYFMPSVTCSTFEDRGRTVAFDLESEEWQAEVIKGPTFGRREHIDKSRFALAELRGTLCVVHNVQHPTSLGGHYANIWLLKNPNTSIWVNEYKIQMPESLLSFTMPLEVLGDGTTLLLLNAFWKAGSIKKYNRYILQFYNSNTKAVTDFMEMAEGFNGRMAFYTGSLLS